MEILWKSKKYLERKYHETILIKDIKEPKNKQLKYNIDIYILRIYGIARYCGHTVCPVLAEYNRDTR